MPAGDRTGPEGQGPGTGRGAGYCAGYDTPGYANPAPGLGRGRGGRGWGRGWGRRAFGWMRRGWWRGVDAPPPTREQEADTLRQRTQAIQSELEALNRRINELEREKDES